MDDVTVVIPTLNEAEGIRSVIEEIKEIGIKNILVVDGGSTDGTVEIAESAGAVVVRQLGRGKADAVKTALSLVKTPYVVFIDGDYTYPARYIPEIVSKLKEGYDEVIGARRLIEPGAMTLVFAFGNRVLTTWFNLLFGTKLTDVLSGLYALRRDSATNLSFTSRGFSIEVEIAAHMASLGEVTEVPISYRRRRGRKKLKARHGFHIALDALRLSWHYNPLFTLAVAGAFLLIPGAALASWVAYKWLLYGVKHYVWGIISMSLIVGGLISGVVAALSLYLKRMERRLTKLLRKCTLETSHQ